MLKLIYHDMHGCVNYKKTDGQTDRYTHTQDNYRNPRACAPPRRDFFDVDFDELIYGCVITNGSMVWCNELRYGS